MKTWNQFPRKPSIKLNPHGQIHSWPKGQPAGSGNLSCKRTFSPIFFAYDGIFHLFFITKSIFRTIKMNIEKSTVIESHSKIQNTKKSNFDFNSTKTVLQATTSKMTPSQHVPSLQVPEFPSSRNEHLPKQSLGYNQDMNGNGLLVLSLLLTISWSIWFMLSLNIDFEKKIKLDCLIENLYH